MWYLGSLASTILCFALPSSLSVFVRDLLFNNPLSYRQNTPAIQESQLNHLCRARPLFLRTKEINKSYLIKIKSLRNQTNQSINQNQ